MIFNKTLGLGEFGEPCAIRRDITTLYISSYQASKDMSTVRVDFLGVDGFIVKNVLLHGNDNVTVHDLEDACSVVAHCNAGQAKVVVTSDRKELPARFSARPPAKIAGPVVETPVTEPAVEETPAPKSKKKTKRK